MGFRHRKRSDGSVVKIASTGCDRRIEVPPKVSIDSKAASQIESYAFTVADDERFRDTKTRWVFRAVSNHYTAACCGVMVHFRKTSRLSPSSLKVQVSFKPMHLKQRLSSRSKGSKCGSFQDFGQGQQPG